MLRWLKVARLARGLVAGSDGEGEFGERRRELAAWLDVGGDVVVAAAEVLHERMPSTHHPRRAESYETTYRPQRDFSRP